MKYYFIFFLYSGIYLILPISAEEINKDGIAKEFYGIYIEKNYFETLKKTKSLAQSQLYSMKNSQISQNIDIARNKSGDITYILFNTKNNESFCFISNMIDGIYGQFLIKSISPDIYLFSCIGDEYYDSVFINKKNDFYIFEIKDNENEIFIDTMIKVTDYKSTLKIEESEGSELLDDYVNSIILEGRYVDSLNKEYTFTSDRKAIWPNARFTYSFTYDLLYGNNSDFIEVEMEPNNNLLYYFYKWEKNKLYFYSKEPLTKENQILELTPINKEK